VSAQEVQDNAAAIQRRLVKVRELLREGNTNFEKREEIVVEVGK